MIDDDERDDGTVRMKRMAQPRLLFSVVVPGYFAAGVVWEGFGYENDTSILAPWLWRGFMVSRYDDDERAWMMMVRWDFGEIQQMYTYLSIPMGERIEQSKVSNIIGFYFASYAHISLICAILSIPLPLLLPPPLIQNHHLHHSYNFTNISITITITITNKTTFPATITNTSTISLLSDVLATDYVQNHSDFDLLFQSWHYVNTTSQPPSPSAFPPPSPTQPFQT